MAAILKSKAIRSMISPAGVTCLMLLLILSVDLSFVDGEALELMRIGTRFSLGLENGTEGYDGQFGYFIARDPDPSDVKIFLDVPAYRYQRILYPITVRLLSSGDIEKLPWIFLLVGLVAQTAGTWVVSRLLENWGVNRWYALTYGLWPGLVAAVRVALPEPLAFFLIAAALYLYHHKRIPWSWLFYGLALFTKEITIIFIAGQLASELISRKWNRALSLLAMTILPFALFQFWLWQSFGQWGVAAGGANATPFEVIPFMGIGRWLPLSETFFWVYTLLYLPFLILPTIWGLLIGLKKVVSDLHGDWLAWLLLSNAAVIPFLPFSTYREPGGMLRFMTGFALILIVYAAKNRYFRVLNYSPLWLILNLLLWK